MLFLRVHKAVVDGGRSSGRGTTTGRGIGTVHRWLQTSAWIGRWRLTVMSFGKRIQGSCQKLQRCSSMNGRLAQKFATIHTKIRMTDSISECRIYLRANRSAVYVQCHRCLHNAKYHWSDPSEKQSRDRRRRTHSKGSSHRQCLGALANVRRHQSGASAWVDSSISS